MDNQAYFDAQLRHQIGVRRFASGQWKNVLRQLEREDRKLARVLRRTLRQAVRSGSINSPEFRTLVQEVRNIRRTSLSDVRKDFAEELVELASLEVEFESTILGKVLPQGALLTGVGVTAVRNETVREAFLGRKLSEWFRTLSASDERRIIDALQEGMTLGEGTNQLVDRVMSGAVMQTRTQAEAVVRTAVNHASNAARNLVWEANSDIVAAIRWTSTLDGRTTAVCQARDGLYAPVGGKPVPKGLPLLDPAAARPPAHVNCRSVMVAILTPDDLEGETRASKFGPVPADTTYGEWLRRQPASFQDEVLGRAKGRLFREGGVPLDKYVDRRGSELTLKELRQTIPEVFSQLGI